MDEQTKQALYRDARSKKIYDQIWQNVGKCVFCDLREKYIFFEENGVVMTISLYAYIDGHFMIIPRRHVKTAKELSELEWDTIRKFSYIAKKLIKDTHDIRGIQLVQKDGADAQSTVEHLHFHCIPFDSPDLCNWNYRELQNTPLENVAAYKKSRKKILEYSHKFDKKYKNSSSLPVFCDVVIVNEKNEILLQEKKPGAKLNSDTLTLPGGRVEDLAKPFVEELAREVYEEIGIKIDADQLQLVASRPSSITHKKHSLHLNATYPSPVSFVWNTYLYKGLDSKTKLTLGDDCVGIKWVKLSKIADFEPLTKDLKRTLIALQDRGFIG